MKIAFVCEGNPERGAASGSAKSMVDGLRARGHEVLLVDARLPKAWRLLNAGLTFSPDRSRWRARFRYGELAFHARSNLARSRLSLLGQAPEVILQCGAIFEPPSSGVPYALYCDWNMALAIRARDNGHCSTARLSLAEQHRMNDRERAIYRGAARIFTISEKLQRSFIEDYGIPQERVVVAYPGPNFDLAGVAAPAEKPADRARRVLFVGKEFERKGGDVLLEAFRRVRQQIGDARLTIIGPADLAVSQDGVEVLGPLRKDVPHERARLHRAFSDADVFCLPTRLEPFGISVVEAMYFGLPCVTTDIWALPEIVVDGATGFTVPVGDAAALGGRLVELLRDDALLRQMGDTGRQRAAELFTWSASTGVIARELDAILAPPAPRKVVAPHKAA